ncbi:MAG: NotI family restriction endonuclease [Bryobacteraceae bacterium]
MALKIVEFFGFRPDDPHIEAANARKSSLCPFVGTQCAKTLSDGQLSGACTVRQTKPESIICCPKRMYANSYLILRDIAASVFGSDLEFRLGNSPAPAEPATRVYAFGSSVGGEIKLPPVSGRGGFFVDWILALVNARGGLEDFVAVEVQSIDTTGNYRGERDAYLNGAGFEGYSKGGINWENVNKRILPQLIYKGHVLRRESLCTKGLYFICPTPVYRRIERRIGGTLTKYRPSQGTLTFRWYDIEPKAPAGAARQLKFEGELTTTVEQVAYAFLSPGNMPPENSYAAAVRAKLHSIGIGG